MLLLNAVVEILFVVIKICLSLAYIICRTSELCGLFVY